MNSLLSRLKTWTDRPDGIARPDLLGLIVLVLLSAWPVRGSLWDNSIPGSGPDIVSTLWGNWWFAQVPGTAMVGGWTDLANHPHGVWGAVLSPTSALVFALLHDLIGIGRASAMVDVVQVSGLCIGTWWLAKRLGVGSLGAFAGALAPLVCRYMIYCLGEASVVAVVGAGIPIGLVGLLDCLERSGREAKRGAVLLGVCTVLVAFENPYLAPVLPGLTVLMTLIWWRIHKLEKAVLKRTLLTLVLGSIGIIAVASLYSQVSSPEYPFERTDMVAYLFGFPMPIIEQPWAAAELKQLLWPEGVNWVLETSMGMQARGGRYVGLSVLLLSIVGAVGVRWKGLAWAFFGWFCLALAMGSMLGPVAGPFLYLNTLMEHIARPLTQPTRYLVPAVVGLGVAVGFAVDAVRARWGARPGLFLVGLLLVDAFALGGLSLRMPSTPLPDADCIRSLADEEGAVLLWPLDATGNVRDLPRAQLLQLLHERPTAQPGIASWAIENRRVGTDLTEAGYHYRERDSTRQVSRVDGQELLDLGFRWLVVDIETLPEARYHPRHWFGQAVDTCGSVEIYAITASRQ